LLEWVTRLEDMGLETIIYTDVDRDGAEVGPDYEGTGDILRESELNVIASGGVGSLEHLRGFENIVTEQLVGVIVGRALYEDNFDFSDAQRALSF
jgi:phosphoribosylformimino-5-aminoimidazole carboxamide ribotide isomerase